MRAIALILLFHPSGLHFQYSSPMLGSSSSSSFSVHRLPGHARSYPSQMASVSTLSIAVPFSTQ